jgi:cold shock CspA family protein
MREERGTILFRDVAKKCGFVVPSSGSDEYDNVFIGSAELARSAVHSLNPGDYIGFVRRLRPGHSAEATNIRLLGAEAADYQMLREGRWHA